MNLKAFETSLLELIRRTSTCLPQDVNQVLHLQHGLETAGSRADLALSLVETNIDLAKRRSLPICQDTGTITFYVAAPTGFDQLSLETAAKLAVTEATRVGYLRQNSVDSVTGANTGDNLGPGSPVFHFHQHQNTEIDIRLILKGGGCENMSAQYSLPATLQGQAFDRDLFGVRGCILDAVQNAQGKGCGPGFLGVCIGGDRATGYEHAKHQLLREVDDTNPDPDLGALEERILEEANRLQIGPMGFGGKLTVGCCKIGKLNRLPASFFVSVSYMCWAYRRRGFQLHADGSVAKWLYQVPGEFDHPVEPFPCKPPWMKPPYGILKPGTLCFCRARYARAATRFTNSCTKGAIFPFSRTRFFIIVGRWLWVNRGSTGWSPPVPPHPFVKNPIKPR